MFLLPACASQTRFSKSFPKRLTETQTFWFFRTRTYPSQISFAGNPQGVISPAQNIQEILDQLVAVSPLRRYSLRAVVVNDSKINARTDGLVIYVNSGLLNMFSGRKDLIASVMAHELGHILGNHQPEGKSRTSSWSYLSYLTPALSVLPYGGIYGSLAGTAVREGVQMRQYSYDRLQENEADAIGVYLASEAGYNALGLSDFLDVAGGSGFGSPRNISVPTSVSGIPQSAAVMLLSSSPLYRTHPPSAKRKKIVNLMLRRKKGLISQAELRKQSGWLAKIYETLELRRPRD